MVQALSHAVLGGAVGCLLGKVLLAYEKINAHLGRFAVIGKNISQILHDAKSPAAVIVTYAKLLKDELSSACSYRDRCPFHTPCRKCSQE